MSSWSLPLEHLPFGMSSESAYLMPFGHCWCLPPWYTAPSTVCCLPHRQTVFFLDGHWLGVMDEVFRARSRQISCDSVIASSKGGSLEFMRPSSSSFDTIEGAGRREGEEYDKASLALRNPWCNACYAAVVIFKLTHVQLYARGTSAALPLSNLSWDEVGRSNFCPNCPPQNADNRKIFKDEGWERCRLSVIMEPH